MSAEFWRNARLLILNSNPDVVQLLAQWFGALGADVRHGRTAELCSDAAHARRFMDDVRPTIVLFDLSIPYNRHWTCFSALRDAGLFGGATIVCTSPNARALNEIVGPTDVFEIIGTPHDLWRLQETIEWRASGVNDAPHSIRH